MLTITGTVMAEAQIETGEVDREFEFKGLSDEILAMVGGGEGLVVLG